MTTHTTVGLIGGTGLDDWDEPGEVHEASTPYGAVSGEIREFRAGRVRVLFLPRHGYRHHIPPHQVNYRANLHALHALGAQRVIAVNAVGAMAPDCAPGSLVMPDQVIDYTWGRAHSFSDQASGNLQHIEFGQPFDGSLRRDLLAAAATAGLNLKPGGCVAVTQGPRLETAAEVARLLRDGCDLVGMTSMPEAALARELGLAYASICVVANWAAGVRDEPISMAAIEHTLAAAMVTAKALLGAYFGRA